MWVLMVSACVALFAAMVLTKDEPTEAGEPSLPGPSSGPQTTAESPPEPTGSEYPTEEVLLPSQCEYLSQLDTNFAQLGEAINDTSVQRGVRRRCRALLRRAFELQGEPGSKVPAERLRELHDIGKTVENLLSSGLPKEPRPVRPIAGPTTIGSRATRRTGLLGRHEDRYLGFDRTTHARREKIQARCQHGVDLTTIRAPDHPAGGDHSRDDLELIAGSRGPARRS